MLKKLLKNKEIKNAGWLIGGKIIQMILSLFVGVLTARYLGPSNYGLINYANAYCAFFMSFCTLGLNAVIIKDFVEHPDEEGVAIGSSLVMRFISSFVSAILIIGIVGVIDFGETETFIVAILCSLSLLFHILDTFNYWFQSIYNSKVTAIATLMAYIATSVYKIILLITKQSIFWFAFATSLDYIVLGIVLYCFYKKNKGPKLVFSFEKSKSLIKRSYHYILSGMMVALYGQTDKLMLKQMLSDTAVGYYSVATAICAMWVFVLSAIIDSLYPTILNLHKTDYEGYKRKNRQLYAIVFYVSIFVSICFQIGGSLVIQILYGEDYMASVDPLRIVTWYTAFSYLGVARNAWIVCENKQKYLKYMYLGAAIINVGLNFALIPLLGSSGAALASLITQIFTSLILPCFWKDMRPNAKLMLEAILLKGVFSRKESK